MLVNPPALIVIAGSVKSPFATVAFTVPGFPPNGVTVQVTVAPLPGRKFCRRRGVTAAVIGALGPPFGSVGLLLICWIVWPTLWADAVLPSRPRVVYLTVLPAT